MLKEASRKIRIRIVDFIMSTSLRVIKEENLRFCDREQRIYAIVHQLLALSCQNCLFLPSHSIGSLC
jgi:hypothetical protein